MSRERGEDEYCRLFAEKVREDKWFGQWLLEKGRFVAFASEATLLADDQARRPAKAWWRHWWCHVRETGRDSETDIFLVFDSGRQNFRFALHIENKIREPLTEVQAKEYSLRAKQMMTNKWAPYSAFETLLIAPLAYLQRYAGQATFFDRSLSYEEIARHIPQFANVGAKMPDASELIGLARGVTSREYRDRARPTTSRQHRDKT